MDKIMAFIAAHRKAVVAVAGAVVLIIGAVAGETSTLYITLVSVLSALGVERVPNVDPAGNDHTAA